MAMRITRPEDPTIPESDDLAVLVEAASRGDELAWRELLSRYARRVYAMVRSRINSAELAEEVTQSVFATVAEKLPKGNYVERGRFESWLFRVTMNRVRDEARRQKRSRSVPLVGVVLQADRSEDRNDDEMDLLRFAMGQLSESDREVVELRHHGELSFQQVADLLNQPVGTLLARHHRALRKLRAIMDEHQKGLV